MEKANTITQAQLEQENKEITRRYREMLKNTYRELSDEDKELIRKAFNVAQDGHKEQRRKSGEPYIFHPLEVGNIVANEIGLGATSIAAALLHDVVEDTDYTHEDMEKFFGEKIASIIEGLTKISNINSQDISMQSENYRKLLLTLSEDFRVILIKIADRLHNMRTLESMPPAKQLKIASETLYIYAPIAHRMGLYNIKSELEDLSLKYTEPELYHTIEKKLEETQAGRTNYIKEFSEIISSKLEEEGVNFSIKGRTKSVHSIKRKMDKQGVSFEEIYDTFAIRIIYKSDRKNEKFLAWKIYSLVTDAFRPNPSRLRDWISQPRSTGYESLHSTVMGPDGKWVEVQIRSERMDEIAEKGIAAHYKYKENSPGEKDENQIENWIQHIRDFLENQQDSNADELINNFKTNLYHKEIFIFTPKGDLRVLPNGATALDFAYFIHTKVGDTCLGAKVNGKLVPINHTLISGDQVEIITSNNQSPKSTWLEFVKTSKARSNIKNALNSEKKQIGGEGKEILLRKLRHLKINFDAKEETQMVKYFKVKSSLELFYKVGIGEIDSKALKKYADTRGVFQSFINRIRRKPKGEDPNLAEKEYNLDTLVFGVEEENLDYKMAKCCSPIPGDEVFGFLSINKGITVHKNNCPNAVDMRAKYDYRVLSAKWIDSSNEFISKIVIQGLDRMGLINEVTQVISSHLHINISAFNINSNNGIFEGKITLEVKNKTQLDKLIERLKNLEGVRKVTRK